MVGGMVRTVGAKDLCDPLEMGVESKRRLNQVACYRDDTRVGGWTGRIGKIGS